MNIIILTIEICVIIVLTYGIYRLYNYYRWGKLEKRFEGFTLGNDLEDNLTFFEEIQEHYAMMCDSLSCWLLKIKIFDEYSNKYEKYILNERVTAITKMHYIANKILIGVGFGLVWLCSCIWYPANLHLLNLLVVFLSGFFVLDIYLLIKERYRHKRIENDMDKAIIIMNNAFKSGYSIMQALCLVYKQLEGPISDEFKKMYMDIAFGLNMEVVFQRFAKRVKCAEASYMATSLSVLNKTGGNITTVFEVVEKNTLARKKLKDELSSVSAVARAMYKILIALPPLLIIILLGLDSKFFKPLFTHPLGIMCLVLSLLTYILYIIIIKRIVYMEVKL